MTPKPEEEEGGERRFGFRRRRRAAAAVALAVLSAGGGAEAYAPPTLNRPPIARASIAGRAVRSGLSAGGGGGGGLTRAAAAAYGRGRGCGGGGGGDSSLRAASSSSLESDHEEVEGASGGFRKSKLGVISRVLSLRKRRRSPSETSTGRVNGDSGPSAESRAESNGRKGEKGGSGAASYKAIAAFITTTVLIWLSEPLLSLVDTTVVSKFASSTSGVAGKAGAASSAVLSLAALGPATLLTDNLTYLTYFLSIATTNRLATSLAKNDKPSMVRSTSHALGVALALGTIVATIVNGFGTGILRWIVGDGGIINGIDMTENLVTEAMSYARIRSLASPLAVMDCVAQSACLATLDMKTPALAVAAASVTNIIGDWLLVVKLGMGVRGAAIATAAATAVSAGMLLREVRRKMRRWDREARAEDTGGRREEASWESKGTVAKPGKAEGPFYVEEMSEPAVLPKGLGVMGTKAPRAGATAARVEPTEENTNDEVGEGEDAEQAEAARKRWEENAKLVSFDIASFKEDGEGEDEGAESALAEPSPTKEEQTKNDNRATMTTTMVSSDKKPSPFISFPDRSSLLALLTLAGPIFFVMLGKIACYSAMTLRTSDFGMMALATHNVLLRVFFFYCTFGDAFSQGVQSFLPGALYGGGSGKDEKVNGDREKGAASGEGGPSPRGRRNARTLLLRMLVLSSVISLLNSGTARWVLNEQSHFLTDEVEVARMMGANSGYFGLAMLLHPAIMLFEGAIIAQRDLGYLVANYGATMLALLALLRFGTSGFGDVWRALFLFQVMRLVQFGTRVWRRTVRGVEGRQRQR